MLDEKLVFWTKVLFCGFLFLSIDSFDYLGINLICDFQFFLQILHFQIMIFFFFILIFC